MQVRLISVTNPLIEVDDRPLTPEGLIAYCARVSSPHQETPDYEKLLSYCISNKHWSIFEMVDMTVEIVTSRAISPQILRHRSFCLDGDSEVYFDLPSSVTENRFNRKKQGRQLYKVKIRDLYKRWHNLSPLFGRQDVALMTKERIANMKIRVYDEETKSLTHSHISNVFMNGVKSCYEVELADGKKIICTDNHKFLTPDGWQPLKDAIGLELHGTTASMTRECFLGTNGIPVHQSKEWLEEHKKRNMSVGEIAESANVSYHTIRKWLRIHGLQYTKQEVAEYTASWNKGKFGYKTSLQVTEWHKARIREARSGAECNLWKGGVERSFRQKVWDFTNSAAKEIHGKHDYTCQHCGARGGKLHVHHIKPVSEHPEFAFDMDNLTTLCENCHHEIHAIRGDAKIWRQKHRGNALTVKWVKVKSIRYAGEREVYDLEVAHSSHNYIANRFIVHNCFQEFSQRYAKAQAIERYEPRRQDSKNRQNSLNDLDEATVRWFDEAQESVAKLAMDKYDEALEKGIAKECARVLLPLATQTKLYMKGSVRSWIHYLEVRTDSGTQKEHRDIAGGVMEIFKAQFPVTSRALGW
ncbi:MAG TPA: FAD-dependent thymidylate synthase [Chlorobaculum sp.]|nr:FAD-dependent thymidylate synthase [Chlorobaculum sp.]